MIQTIGDALVLNSSRFSMRKVLVRKVPLITTSEVAASEAQAIELQLPRVERRAGSERDPTVGGLGLETRRGG